LPLPPPLPPAAGAEGLRFEKREFWSCWALEDQKEGMAAFAQKRKPQFKNQ
jgi:enoyl-CoA hydratase